jgi:hypothetical protein
LRPFGITSPPIDPATGPTMVRTYCWFKIGSIYWSMPWGMGCSSWLNPWSLAPSTAGDRGRSSKDGLLLSLGAARRHQIKMPMVWPKGMTRI